MVAPATAPVALFVYNRPEHAERTVASLLQNSAAAASHLYIFSDGAKSAADVPAVEQTRARIRGVTGFASVSMVEREKNLGLANSIIDGVTRLCKDHGRAIVLEDDLLLSPFFLRYMNDGLARYADVAQVASIHGYTYPVDRPLPETFFLRGADCWGWATWARAWQVFEPDAAGLLAELRSRGLAHAFDFDNTAGYVRMLEDFVAGRNNSWAVRWHASAYLRGMLTLYPGRSLVRNIGIDGSGTHSGDIDVFDSGLADRPVEVEAIPIAENIEARGAFKRHFRSTYQSLMSRLVRRARRVLTRNATQGASR